MADEVKPIYLDNNATTPLDPKVLEAMMPYLTDCFGNAASRSHAFGWEAERAVDRARRQVGDLINARGREIIFVSGATEGDNLALIGATRQFRDRGNHVVTCKTEHKAVLDTLHYLEQEEGIRVTYLDPDECGVVKPDKLAAAIEESTILVALMVANNELGSLHPMEGIGAVCKERGVFFFADGAQAVGKIPIDVERMGIDVLTMSAHKFYGPKGVGAVYVRRRNPSVRLEALIHGGGHERGMRSGTLNVPGIVGMGRAAELAKEDLDAEVTRLSGMRDRFEAGVKARLDHVKVNGCHKWRLPGTSNISFRYVEGESLMMGVRGLAISSGSACNSASLEVSHVLRAIRLDPDLAQASLRISFGRFNTDEDVDAAIEQLCQAVERLREVSPAYQKILEEQAAEAEAANA